MSMLALRRMSLAIVLVSLCLTPAFGDDERQCAFTERPNTVFINGCDSGVPNYSVPGACFISDEINVCAVADKHGEFVSCVAQITTELLKAGVISGEEKGAIMSCAGPKPRLL
jgi:hypothetical protein